MSWVCTLASGRRDPCRPSRARLQRRDAEHQPVSAKDLAVTLPPSAWQTVSWRAGSRGDLSGRFAALRVRPSHRDYGRAEPHPEEWLLIEWPAGDTEPSQYWLSTLPATTTLVDLVHRAKLRWRIEIVFTQMTKARPLAVRTERDDIADFNLTVGDHHAVNQQFHELTPLGEVSIGQSRLNPSAEIRGRCCPARELCLTIDLSFQLVSLGVQRLGFVFYRLAPTLVLRQGNDPELVCLGQTL